MSRTSLRSYRHLEFERPLDFLGAECEPVGNRPRVHRPASQFREEAGLDARTADHGRRAAPRVADERAVPGSTIGPS